MLNKQSYVDPAAMGIDVDSVDWAAWIEDFNALPHQQQLLLAQVLELRADDKVEATSHGPRARRVQSPLGSCPSASAAELQVRMGLARSASARSGAPLLAAALRTKKPAFLL